MIRVDHMPADWDCPPNVSWGIKDAIPGETADYIGPYFAGIYPPHYPMPAIQTLIDIGPTEINLWVDPVEFFDLVEWRKCLVTWSVYGPPIYLSDNPLAN